MLGKKLHSSFNMDQEGKIFKIYSNICEKFQQNFHRQECLEMNNLSLKRICQANFLILFLTQFEIKDDYQCLEDQKILSNIRTKVLNINNFLEINSELKFNDIIQYVYPITGGVTEVISNEFNFLQSNDVLLSVEIVKNLNSELQMICMDFEYNQ